MEGVAPPDGSGLRGKDAVSIVTSSREGMEGRTQESSKPVLLESTSPVLKVRKWGKSVRASGMREGEKDEGRGHKQE